MQSCQKSLDASGLEAYVAGTSETSFASTPGTLPEGARKKSFSAVEKKFFLHPHGELRTRQDFDLVFFQVSYFSI